MQFSILRKKRREEKRKEKKRKEKKRKGKKEKSCKKVNVCDPIGHIIIKHNQKLIFIQDYVSCMFNMI